MPKKDSVSTKRKTGKQIRPAGGQKDPHATAEAPTKESNGLLRRFVIGPQEAGLRIDAALAILCPDQSRNRIQQLMKANRVAVRDCPVKPGAKAEEGWIVSICFPPPEKLNAQPEDIPIEIIYEDGDIVVVDKPAGMTSHPAPGNRTGTLVNALLHHCPNLSGIGGVQRPGIVHRLDKGTSGVMVVTKNDRAHRTIASQFKEHEVKKTYLTIVWDNIVEEEGTISVPIGRDRRNRKKMSVKSDKLRDAVTNFRVRKRFGWFTLLEVFPETGRTHQIRVHMAYFKHPVVGDPLYGRRVSGRQIPYLWKKVIATVKRPLLHAYEISFNHPSLERTVTFCAPPPADLRIFIERDSDEG